MKIASNFVLPLKDSEQWSQIWDISVFDHWLTHDEADNCDVLCYGIAIKQDKLDEYLQGENTFINFYTALSDEVIIFHNPNGICHLSTQSKRFERILKQSLRESRMPYWFYPKIGVMVVGGFDRTDILLASEKTDSKKIEKLLTDNQLNILSRYSISDEKSKEVLEDIFDF